MDRPLWRIVLHIMLLAFVVQRGAHAVIFYLGGAPPVLIAGMAATALAGLVASIAIWSGRFISGSLLALAAVIALAAILQVATLGAPAAPAALGQALIAVMAALGLRYLIARAQNEPG